MRTLSPRLQRYGVALLASGFALLIRALIGPAISPSVFLPSYAAVVFSAWYGGVGPGILAVGLSTVGGTHLFLPPLHYPLDADDWVILLRVGVFVVVAAGLAWMTAAFRRTHQGLELAEERLRLLVDGVKDYAIFMLDHEGRIVSWNAGAQRMYHYAADEVIGRHYSCLQGDGRAEGSGQDAHLILAAEQGGVEHERERVRKDGSRFWANVVVTPLHGPRGELIGFSKVTRDITERKEAEEALQQAHHELEARVTERTADLSKANTYLREQVAERLRATAALRESEEQFASAFQFAPIGIVLVGLDGAPFQVNRALCEMLGYREAELLSRQLADVTYPDEVPTDSNHLRRLLAGELGSYQLEQRFSHKTGHVVWVLLSVSVVRDDHGKPLHLICQFQDITERRRAEEQLRQSEERFRRLVDSDIIGIVIADIHGNITEANDAFLRSLGYPREDLLQGRLRWDQMTPPEWRHVDEVAIEQLKLSGTCRPFQKELIRRDGSRLPVLVGAMFLDASQGVGLSFVLDITEQKHAEEELRRSDERFRKLVDSDIIGIIIGDTRGHITEANDVFLKSFGYTREDLLQGRIRWDQMTPPEWRHLDGIAIEQLRLSGTCRPWQKEYIHRDGSRVPVVVGATFLDAAREVALSFVLDITEQKRTEAELRHSEERFKLAVEAANDGLWDWNLVENKLYFSPRLKRILGYEELEIEPEPGQWMRRVHPDDQARVAADISALVFGRSRHFENEHRLRHKDGSYRWVLLRGLPVRDETGKPYRMAGSLSDIHHRKHAQEALRESEERYREMVEEINDVIFMLDATGRLTYISPVVERMSGYQPSELLGDGFTRFLFPADMPAAMESVRKNLAGATAELDYRIVNKSGEVRWLHTSSRPVFDGERVVGVRGVTKDITDRKHAEMLLQENEARFRTLAETVAAATFIYQGNRLRYANPAAEAITGYTREELLGINFWDVIHPDFRGPAQERALARQRGEPVPSSEVKICTKGGAERWVDFTGGTIEFDGEPAILGTAFDITARKEAEEALQEREMRLRALVEQVPAILWTTDTELRFTSAQGSGLGALLDPTDRNLGATLSEFFKTPDPDFPAVAAHRRALAGEAVTYEIEWRGRAYRTRLQPLRDAASRITGVVGVGLDITERKRAEEALIDSEKRFRALIEHSSDIIGILRPDATSGYFGPSVTRVLGYSAHELMGADAFDLIHPDDRQPMMRAVSELVQSPGKVVMAETRLRHKDGSWRWLEAIASNLLDEPGVQGIIVNSRDITDRRHAERELRRSEERFALAVAGANDGLWDWNLDTDEIYVSPRLKAILGLDAQDVPPAPGWGTLVHPDDRERVQMEWQAHLEGRSPFYEVEHRSLHKDGTYRWVLARGMSVRDANGTPYRMVGSLTDITARKRVEEALRESEEKFRTIFEEGPLGMAIVGVDGRFIRANNTLCRILGYSQGDLVRRGIADVTHPDDLETEPGHVRRLLDGEMPFYDREKRYVRSDGDIVWGHLTASIIRDHRGAPLYGIAMIDDISDRKRAEEDARQRQAELAHVLRVSTMNEMASGLAHEINQPLSAIVSYAKGCVRRLQLGTSVSAEMIATQQEIAAEALRAGEVIRRLRQFVRKEPPRREWLDLNELVRGAIGLVHADAREHGIAVHLKMATDLPRVHVDRVQIEQVILNLVRNGFEAMDGTVAERRALSVHTSIALDASLEVAICDSGIGLTPDVADSVFNPFFTTKPNGLGMGLAISRLIIESHGGQLWATSGTGHGTTFHFKLPGLCIGASDGD